MPQLVGVQVGMPSVVDDPFLPRSIAKGRRKNHVHWRVRLLWEIWADSRA